MRRHSSKGAHALTLVVLTTAVGLSGRVEAQQTGLFPLAPIRRQRVPCDREDPTYKVYKQQYFGYHPTCWRTFPPGWGCPSAEAPDFERSKRELPPNHATEEDAAALSPFEDQGAPRPRPAAPGNLDLPQDRVDPFGEMDQPQRGVPNAAPLPRNNNAAPRANPTPRGGNEDPFRDLNPPPGAAAAPPPNGTPPPGGRAAAGDAAPELSAPANRPAAGSASRDGEDGDEPASAAEGPLLGLSDSDIARQDGAGYSRNLPAGATAAEAGPGEVVTAPAPSSPPRRRIFGNLLGSLGSNWLRR